MRFTIILTIAFFALAGCYAKVNKGIFSIRQGITGRVLWKEGNFMPSPGRPNRNNGTPVVRTLLIYKLTNLSQVSGQSPFYKEIRSQFVKKTRSTTNGYFQVKLPPGSYSIFSAEADGAFASRMDGKGNINPVKVEPGRQTTVTFLIDYKAAY